MLVEKDDPILTKIASEIELNSDVSQLINDLKQIMTEKLGCGIAAPQIGKSVCLFLVKTSTGIKVFINPKITKVSKNNCNYEIEGCLSLPDVKVNVKRYYHISIEYFDENWKFHKMNYSGMVARIIQHEYDHLNGILITQYLECKE